MSKDQSRFDATDAGTIAASDEIGSYLLGKDGKVLTETAVAGKNGLDVNIISPVKYSPGTVDVFGNVVTGKRINKLEVDFALGTVASKLNITNSGGGTSSIANGQATFSSGTATTADSKGVTLYKINYEPGHEVYAEFTAAFTTPTSVNSFQRIGLYDSNNGFYLGFTGTTFGIARRSGGSDTFVAKASFNIDNLTGASTSLFTRLGIPEAIDLTKINVWRIRFGWLGAASIFFEVLSPDSTWVTFHSILYANTFNVVSIQSVQLPITLHINKASADATNLIMQTGCWAAGTTLDQQFLFAPDGAVKVSSFGTPQFADGFEGTDLDFVNNWFLPMVVGTSTYSVANSFLTISTGTTANNQFHLTSINTNLNALTAPLNIDFSITLESTLVTGVHRFWGLATQPAVATITNPITDGIGFEITTAGQLAAVIYNSGVKTFSQNISAITDGVEHTYSIQTSTSNTYWLIDSGKQAVAFVDHVFPASTELPTHFHVINGASTLASAPVFIINSTVASNRSTSGQPVNASTLGETFSSFAPNPASYPTGNESEIQLDGSNQLMVRSTILTDEGSFREDFGGSSLTANLSGTCQFINGKLAVIGIGTAFTSEINVGDYIKKVTDSETLYVQVGAITSDTRLVLNTPYQGTTAAAASALVSHFETSTPATGSFTLANSIITLNSGVTNGNNIFMVRQGDYSPFNLLFSASISQRIANQTIILGFVDDPNNVSKQALFQFTGTDNTKVTCISAFSNLTGDIESETVTLPNSALTSTYNTYEVDVTSQDVTFLINKKIVARHTTHLPGPYDALNLVASIQNSATVTTTALNLDYVFFSNVDRLEVGSNFNGDPIRISAMGISATTGLPVDLNLDNNGNLIVSSQIISSVPAATFKNQQSINAGVTIYTAFTAAIKMGLKQFYAGGTGIAKQTLYSYLPSTTQLISFGDFESTGDVSNWPYFSAGGAGSGTVAFSTAQHFTGAGSAAVTFTQSDANHSNGILQTFSSPQDFSSWRYVTAEFYNTVSSGGAYTRTISIVLTDVNASTKKFDVSGLSTSSPFNTAGWIKITGEIANPTSSTGTAFDNTQIASIELRFVDSANKSGTVYWDTARLEAQISPIFPIYHQANTSFNIGIDPVFIMNIGDQVLIAQTNNDTARKEYFAEAAGVAI